MSAERAAKQILRACRNGEREVVLRNPLNMAVTQSLLGAVARLPPRVGGIGARDAYGYESQSRWSPRSSRVWATRRRGAITNCARVSAL